MFNYKNTLLLMFLLLTGVLLASGCGPSTKELITQHRQKYVNSQPDLSLEKRNAILSGVILPGMTKKEVVGCLGRPHSLLTVISANARYNDCFVYYDTAICFENELAERACNVGYVGSGAVVSFGTSSCSYLPTSLDRLIESR